MNKRIQVLAAALMTVGVVATTAAQAKPLTEAQARVAIAPLYDALNVSNDKDSADLVRNGTTDDWMSCNSNDNCAPRDKAAQAIAGYGKMLPDMKWAIKEVIVSGNRVIVRGEGSGTPAGEFFGVPHTGKSFKIMSVDIHTIKNGKLSGKTYHLEDWAGALRQLSTK